jgi:hypothetical protein
MAFKMAKYTVLSDGLKQTRDSVFALFLKLTNPALEKNIGARFADTPEKATAI